MADNTDSEIISHSQKIEQVSKYNIYKQTFLINMFILATDLYSDNEATGNNAEFSESAQASTEDSFCNLVSRISCLFTVCAFAKCAL